MNGDELKPERTRRPEAVVLANTPSDDIHVNKRKKEEDNPKTYPYRTETPTKFQN